MDHAVGTCDLTGQTHTEYVAYEGMIDGCHVFTTADWYFSDVTCWTVVQQWNFTMRLLHRQTSPAAARHQRLQI